MRHNFVLLLLLCINGVLNGADVGVDTDEVSACRARVENLVTLQVKKMHDEMTKHCSLMGLEYYNR